MTRSNPFDTAGDPWEATAIDGDEPFGEDDDIESARDSFPSVDWIIGRLVLVWPMELLTGLKGQGTGTYDSMVCRVVVLDGEPNQDLPKIPIELIPFRFNSDSIINDLKHLVGGTKPKLARVNETASKYNSKIMARFFAAPSKQDLKDAREYLAAHRR